MLIKSFRKKKKKQVHRKRRPDLGCLPWILAMRPEPASLQNTGTHHCLTAHLALLTCECHLQRIPEAKNTPTILLQECPMGESRLPGSQDSCKGPMVLSLALHPTPMMGWATYDGPPGAGLWYLASFRDHSQQMTLPAWALWHLAPLSQAGHTPGPPRKHIYREVRATLATYNPHNC